MPKAINVTATNATAPHLPRSEMLAWVNLSLQAQFSKIDELCTGAAYCQFMDALFPGSVNLQRVRYKTNLKYEFIENFKVLQAAFKKVSVERTVPIEKLIKGRFQDNLEFLQWFKKFFDANDSGREYDASAVRQGAPMGYGAGEGKAGKARRVSRMQAANAAATPAAAKNPKIVKVLSRANPTVEVELKKLAKMLDKILMSEDAEQWMDMDNFNSMESHETEAESAVTEVINSIMNEVHKAEQSSSHLKDGQKTDQDNAPTEEKPIQGKEVQDSKETEEKSTENSMGDTRELRTWIYQCIFYCEKCRRIEDMCSDPTGSTLNKEILDQLYATEDGFYPPDE